MHGSFNSGGITSAATFDHWFNDVLGTNLSMVRLAAEAERWLNKPVIAINAATYWFALRDYGINDTQDGYGRLMAEFAELPDDYAAVAAE